MIPFLPKHRYINIFGKPKHEKYKRNNYDQKNSLWDYALDADDVNG